MTFSPALITALDVFKAPKTGGVKPTSGLFGLFAARRERERLNEMYTQLMQFDDHMLRDIGMTRMDVMRAREALFRK